MFMGQRIFEIARIHCFFHEKKVIAENLPLDWTRTDARSSPRPEDLAASGVARGLLPEPRDAPLEFTGPAECASTT